MKFMQWSCIVLLVCLNTSIHAQEKGIQWATNLSWPEIMQKAKAENKYIFLDCYATWCGPCHAMDKDVYADELVGKVYNEQFICVKIQMDKTTKDSQHIKEWYNDAVVFQKNYAITAFPTFLFLSPDGMPLHRAVGYRDKDEFVALAKDAQHPDKQYYSLLKNYKPGKLDTSELKGLANMLSSSGGSLATEMAIEYLSRVPNSQVGNLDNINLMCLFRGDPKMQDFVSKYLAQISKADFKKEENLNLINNFSDITSIRSQVLNYLSELNAPELYSNLSLIRVFKNDSLAKAIANRYINALKKDQLFSKEILLLMGDFINTSNERAFSIFYKYANRVDKVVLNSGYALSNIMNVIMEEEYNKYYNAAVKDSIDNIPWESIFQTVKRKYNETIAKRLNIELRASFYGAMASNKNRYWPEYINYYIQLIEQYGTDTTGPQHQFVDAIMLNNFAFNAILNHSNDSSQINTGLKWMEGVIRRNPTSSNSIDTYANLLYKAHRQQEAIQWQEKAIQIAIDNKNTFNLATFQTNLLKMKRGEATWDDHTQIDPPVSAIISSLPVRSIGPAGRDGTRFGDVAVYEKNSKIFYFSSSNGGVLKTTNGGKTCHFIFDKEGSASIGDIEISQNNPDIVWVGTGDKWQRNSVGMGDGIYKSVDGGKTWACMGLKNSVSIGKIAIDPTNDNIVLVAVLGSPWGYGPDRGIYKTSDGGITWKKVLYLNEKSAGTEIIIDPKNPKNMLAALWDHIHRPYGWFETGPGSGIYRSTDGGDTWKKITKGLPNVNFGRVAMDYFRADPNEAVALVEAPDPSQNIFRSHDGGQTWEAMPAVHYNPPGTLDTRPGSYWYRPYYNWLIRFDPQNKDVIYAGQPGHVSKDGGKTFIGSCGDDHGLWIDPQDSLHFIFCGDLSISQSWGNLESGDDYMQIKTPPLFQTYSVGFDMRKLYRVMGVGQDAEVVWGVPTQSLKGRVVTEDKYESGYGEGGAVMADPNDWTTVYSGGYAGYLLRTDLKAGDIKLVNNSNAYGYAAERDYEKYKTLDPKIRGGWNGVLQISPWNSKTIYLGTNYLMKTVDKGDTWETISPELTHNNPAWQVPDGVVYRNNENSECRQYQTIRTICESPAKQGVIWVGTDCGYVQLTQDGGKTWTNLTKNIPGIPEYCWVNSITASRYKPGRAYVVFDNHRNFDLIPHVYVTEDFGKTWSKISGNIPNAEPCRVIKEGVKNPDLLYLGTEFGLWVSLDRGNSWTKYKDFQTKDAKGYFPSVAVHDLQVHPREMDLIIGSHGRGIWILPAKPLEELTSENLAKEVCFLEPGNVYLFPQIKEQMNNERGADDFSSDNTQPGTLFSFYLKREGNRKVSLKISDAADKITYDSIAITQPTKAGLNTFFWSAKKKITQPGDYRLTLSVDGKEYYQTLHVEDATDEVLPGCK